MKTSNPKHGSLLGGTFIDREIYLSPAWTSLSKNGHKAFMAFYDARRFPKSNGKKGDRSRGRVCLNKDDLGITHGNLERFGIPRGKVSAAVSECMAKGFIELKRSGGRSRGDRNIYALSEKWRYWKPGSEPCQKREKREKHGYQGRRLGAVAKWKTLKQGDQEQSVSTILGHNPEDVKHGEVQELEAKIREVINNHSETRRAKKFWSDTILSDLKDQFQKANVDHLNNGGELLVSMESIYERFLNRPDEIIDNIQKRYPYEPKWKKHRTQNVVVT
jgi:hypothetical protein